MIDEDDELFYPGSTTVRRSAGGEGPVIPDTEPQEWEHMGRRFVVETGQEVTFFPISALACALGRSVKTVRHWDQDNILPETYNRTDSSSDHGRWRLYTAAQIAGLQRIARDEGLMNNKRVYVRKTQFTARAQQLFDDLDDQ